MSPNPAALSLAARRMFCAFSSETSSGGAAWMSAVSGCLESSTKVSEDAASRAHPHGQPRSPVRLEASAVQLQARDVHSLYGTEDLGEQSVDDIRIGLHDTGTASRDGALISCSGSSGGQLAARPHSDPAWRIPQRTWRAS
jgi:hypothetical protein